MIIKLPNGVEVNGTSEQIQDVMTKLGYTNLLGDDRYYFSETKGAILISDMNTMHLRNAILKYYETWVADLHKIKNPKEVVKLMMDGINNATWLAMVEEYAQRDEE
jgi:Fe-S cluster assembly iron-binding protein IscA